MPASIFQGDFVKNLKGKLNLADNVHIITGESDDPTAVAKDAPIGSIYVKSDDGSIFRKLDAGSSTNWELLGAGSGGSKNYFAPNDAEINTNIGDWATDDGAGSTSGGLTLSLNTTPSEILAGKGSLQIDKDAADRDGHFAKVALLDIDPSDRGRLNSGSFEFRPLSGYVSGDLSLEIYDVTNAAVLYSGPSESLNVLNAKGKFVYTTTLEESTAQVEFRLKVSNSNTNAFSVVADEFKFGPTGSFVVQKIDDWVPYTPVFTGLGSVSNVDFYYKRVGDSVAIKGSLQVGTPSATLASFSLPNGGTISTFFGTRNSGTYGRGANTSSNGGFLLISAGENSVKFSDAAVFGSSSVSALSNANGTSISLSSEFITVSTNLIQVSELEGLDALVNDYELSNTTPLAMYKVASNNTPGANNPINFAEKIEDRLNNVSTGPAWGFNAEFTGELRVTTNIQVTSPGSASIFVFVTGASGSTSTIIGNPNVNANVNAFAGVVKVRKGDEVSIRCDGSFTFTTNSTVTIERAQDLTTLGVIPANGLREFGPYDLTVTGTNSWSTVAAIGNVTLVNGSYALEFQIEGTSASTNSVDILIDGISTNPAFTRHPVLAVGAISTSATCTAQLREATGNIEIRGTTSSNWYVQGRLLLDAKPTFIEE